MIHFLWLRDFHRNGMQRLVNNGLYALIEGPMPTPSVCQTEIECVLSVLEMMWCQNHDLTPTHVPLFRETLRISTTFPPTDWFIMWIKAPPAKHTPLLHYVIMKNNTNNQSNKATEAKQLSAFSGSWHTHTVFRIASWVISVIDCHTFFQHFSEFSLSGYKRNKRKMELAEQVETKRKRQSCGHVSESLYIWWLIYSCVERTNEISA